MKTKICVVLFAVLATMTMFVSCAGNENSGCGYNNKSKKSRPEYNLMYLIGTDGETHGWLKVFRGEYGGHSWFIFYDNGTTVVVHDPDCKCHKSM